MLLTSKVKLRQLLHGLLYFLIIIVFFLLVAIQLLLETLNIQSVEIASLPLLQPGSVCYASLVLDYSIPNGLPDAVENGLLQIKRQLSQPIFSVTDSEIATVTSDGKIIGQHIGATTLSVTIGGLCQSTELIVGGIPIESLQIILPAHRLDVGTTIVPSVQLIPGNADYYSDIEFYSSDDSILHKNADGSFIAASTGVVKLYAKTYSEQLIETYQTIYVTSHNSI